MVFNWKHKIKSLVIDGETIYVRSMTAKELIEMPQDKHTGFFIVLKSLCDENGKRLLGDDQINLIHDMPSYVLNPLVQAAMAVNRLTDETFDDVKKN